MIEDDSDELKDTFSGIRFNHGSGPIHLAYFIMLLVQLGSIEDDEMSSIKKTVTSLIIIHIIVFCMLALSVLI